MALSPQARPIPRDESDPRIGQVVDGRYRIRKCIGSGGMGLVYLADRVRIGRSVAVKFLHDSAAEDARVLHRFEVEARALGKLEHPHCVSVIDFGVADVPYIVMEYVAGPTLRDALDNGPLPVARCIAIARQLLGGLAHAHDRGIVHRDIKPENVKLEEVTGTSHHVRLLDFGLAKLRDAVAWMPPSNPFITVGTPSYMSPEQFAGAEIDARSDLYSTGAMLFELLTGKKPFEFDEPREGFEMHRSWPRPRLRRIAPDAGFSEELENVVLRAMATSPEDRFQTAIELTRALDETPEGQVGATPRELTAETTARIAPRRSRTRLQLVLAVMLAAAALAAAFVAIDRTRVHADPAPAAAPTVSAPALEPTPAVAAANAEPVTDADEPEDELAALERLRSERPDDPEVLVQLGDAYFTRSRWSKGLRLYRRALRLEPSMRERQEILDNAIRALGSKRSHRKAAHLIEHQLGAVARPRLEQVAQEHRSRRVRKRAAKLLTRLSEPNR